MKRDSIAEISIDASGRLHVRPAVEVFPYVWRAAMEVQWSEASGTLHSPVPRVWSYTDWFRQIVAAVKDEYGYHLQLTPQTLWSNVDPETQKSIVAATHNAAYQFVNRNTV